jgi:glycosyltransferase involved in cell wall biosynthesis
MRVLNIVSDSVESSASIHHVHLHIEQQLRLRGVVTESLLLTGAPHKDFGPSLVGSFDTLRRPRKYPIAYRILRAKVRQRIVSGNYTCVIADGMMSANLLLDIQSTIDSGIRYLLVVHGRVTAMKPRLPVLRKAIRRGELPQWQVVAVSEDSAAHLEAQLPASLCPVEVAENCIDVEAMHVSLLDRVQARKALSLRDDQIVIGAVGRMSAEKDYPTLIRAFALCDLPNAVLLLIGDGKERFELEGVARQNGVADKVVFTGFLAEARRYMKAYDCFVMGSRTEGSPIALLEAMAAGSPIVSSSIPPLANALPPSYPYVFEVGNPSALTEQLDNLMAMSGSERKLLGNSLVAHVKRRFSPQLFGDKYYRLVGGVLDSRGDDCA